MSPKNYRIELWTRSLFLRHFAALPLTMMCPRQNSSFQTVMLYYRIVKKSILNYTLYGTMTTKI
jgi:hypothetical protein